MTLGRKKVEEEPATEAATEEAQWFLKWGADMQRALAQSVQGVMVRGARAVPVGTAPNALTRPATSGANALMGFALRNPSDTETVTVTLWDGSSSSDGDFLMEIELSPLESVREWFGLAGISLQRGLVYDDPDHLTRGSVFLRGSDY